MDTRKILHVSMFTPGLNGRWGLPLLWWGKPGVGKSRVIETVATALGLMCHTLVASIREPADFGGLPIPVERGRRRFMEYAPPGWASDFEIDGDGRGVVFVDELTTTAPATQAALLRMVLDGALGDYYFPRGVRFVAAANPVADAAGGWDLTPPLANRFGHLNWESPEPADWCDWLIGANGASTDDVGDDERISSETEEARVMAAWPTAFAKAKGVVAGFVKARPDLLHRMPDAGSSGRGKAWPSHRTWEMATRALAGCDVHGADDIIVDELVASFVGPGAGSELTTFRTKVKLPDPEAVLDGKVKFKHEPARLDRTVAVLSSCSALVTSGKCERQNERSEKLWEIIGGMVGDAADLTVPAARALVRKRLHQGGEAKKSLIALQPILEAAGVRP